MIANKNNNPVTQLKTPPHSIEAEQSVLGSLMIAPAAIDKVVEFLKVEHFYNHSHQTIYTAIMSLIEKSNPVDLVTVSESLEKTEKLEDAGGFSYIAELAKNTPSAANVAAYARIIEQKAILRFVIGAANDIAEKGFNPEGDEAKEVLLFADNKIGKIIESCKDRNQDTSLVTALGKALDRMQAANDSGGLTGVSSPLPDLDRFTSGFQNSDLIILAARPSMGKTALAINIAVHAAKQRNNVVFFSLEMPADQIAQRAIAYESRVEASRLRNPIGEKIVDQEGERYINGMEDEHWAKVTNAVGGLKELDGFLEIDDASSQTVLDLRIQCKKLVKKRGKLNMILVDYLQIMSGGKAENRTQEISNISKGLKALAKEFDCPVIALSQLSRKVEERADKRPINSDLRESGSIEQDADLIMFVYRDEYYNPNSPDKGLAEINIGKQRNGPLGKVGAVFQGQFNAFLPMANRQLMAKETPAKPYKRETLELG